MAIGGSLVQTNTDVITIAPLAQMDLSWRPLIVPSQAKIRVKKTADGRGNAWVSLDGANRFKLEDDESMLITGSEHPLRFVTYKSDDLTDLWVKRLKDKLGFANQANLKAL
jgi:NAD kinase